MAFLITWKTFLYSSCKIRYSNLSPLTKTCCFFLNSLFKPRLPTLTHAYCTYVVSLRHVNVL